ncbi:MAG: glycosyltransferase family 39 protein [Tannerellaceae bacterium]|nr:glycosyltransferase family 39 protein [Tannerellaceae bacterium]
MYLVSSILLLLLFSPWLFLRDYSPGNELRYLSIADEALRDRHIFGFMHQGVSYADKPPLYLWLLMGVKKITGSYPMGIVSLFSMLPALFILGIMFKWTAGLTGKKDGFIAVILLMTTGLFAGTAVFVRMDMLMCMFIVLSLYLFYRIYTGQDGRYRKWALTLCLFLAVFTKGPLGILFPVISMLLFLLYKKKINTIRQYLDWPQFLFLFLLSGVWFGAVWIEKGSDYLYNLTFHQTVNRAVDAFHHKSPFYYYGIAILYAVAPWTFFIGFSLVTGIRKRLIKDDIEKFFVIIVLSQFILLSCISSKLAVYLLPLLPFLMYVSVLIVKKSGYTHWLAVSIWLTVLLFTISLPVYLFLINRVKELAWLENIRPFVITGWLVNLLCNGYAVYTLHTKRDILHSAGIIAVGVLLFLFIAGWGIPSINNRIGYRELSRAGIELAERSSSYFVFGLERPESMDVFLHVPVQTLSVDEILSGKYSGNILFIGERSLKEYPEIQAFVTGKTSMRTGKGIAILL